jgi:positive regulator of sigma E activity
VNAFFRQPPSSRTQELVGKVVVLGFVLPLVLLLLLQTTRYSLFPGKARFIWGALDVIVFGYLALNSVWRLMDRRQKQANTR